MRQTVGTEPTIPLSPEPCTDGNHGPWKYDFGFDSYRCEKCRITPMSAWQKTRDIADQQAKRIAELETDLALAHDVRGRTGAQLVAANASLSSAEERIRQLSLLSSEVPTSWLDPLLTGPARSLLDVPADCEAIEHLLRAIRKRIDAKVSALLNNEDKV